MVSVSSENGTTQSTAASGQHGHAGVERVDRARLALQRRTESSSLTRHDQASRAHAACCR